MKLKQKKQIYSKAVAILNEANISILGSNVITAEGNPISFSSEKSDKDKGIVEKILNKIKKSLLNS